MELDGTAEYFRREVMPTPPPLPTMARARFRRAKPNPNLVEPNP